MKITCDFCNTEYTLDKMPNTPVRCAVCGHVWSPRIPFRQRATMKLIAAICAFIAACIFCAVVVLNFSNPSNTKPLITTIDEKNIHIVTDENGAKRIFVSGDITNTTNDIYGLPNIVIVSYDANDNVLSRQAFVPPSTLLEPRTTVTFTSLSMPPTISRSLSSGRASIFS